MSGSDKEHEHDDADSETGKLPPELRSDPDAKTYLYRDFSNLPADPNEEEPPQKRGNSESSIRVQKFPVKLYAILAQKEFADIVTWMPHGRSWKVLKPNQFESLVMPLFFEYSNYHSFNRLVNAWSFRRISSGPDRGSYYHELFLRGKPHLQKYMRRLPKTHKKLAMRKQDEPDFYKMDKTNPLPQLEETSANVLAMRRQAMAQAAVINAGSQPYAGVASLNPAAGRLPSYATPGYPIGPAAASRFGALDPSLGSLGAPSFAGAASLPSAASLAAAASLPGRASLGLPLPPIPPQDLSARASLGGATDPAAAQNYQYQRMRHLQHLQLFQRQMSPPGAPGAAAGSASAPAPTAAEEELLRLQQQQGYGAGGTYGAGQGRPY